MALQRDPVTFGRLKALSMRKRMEIAQAPDIAMGLLSSLTPTDLALLFPTYYKKILPDVSGFRAAISKQSSEQQAAAQGSLLQRLSAVEATAGVTSRGSISRPWAERTSAAKMPAQLSPEQMAVWNKLQQGAIGINSPDAKLFSSLSASQLASIGITKTKDNTGAEVYQYAQPSATREEAVGRLQAEAGLGGKGKYTNASAARLIRSIGGNEEESAFLGALVLQESQGGNPRARNDANPGRERSYGLWQININAHTFDKDYMRNAGVSSVEDLYDPVKNAKVALYLYRHTNPRKTWGAYGDLVNGRSAHGSWEKNYAAAQLGATGASLEAPRGSNGHFTDEQISKMMDQLRTEKNEQRRQELTTMIVSAGGAQATQDATAAITGKVTYGQVKDFSQYILHEHSQKQCGQGARILAGHMYGHGAFLSEGLGVGGSPNAGSLSQGNNYFQRSGLFHQPKHVSEDSVKNQAYLDSLPIGTVVSATKSGGAGHVQVKIGPGQWASDFKQQHFISNGYSNFAVHMPNDAGLEALKRNGVDQSITSLAGDEKVVDVAPLRMTQRPGEAPEAPPPPPPATPPSYNPESGDDGRPDMGGEITASVDRKEAGYQQPQEALNPQAVKDIQAPGAPSTAEPQPAAPVPKSTPNKYSVDRAGFIAAIKETPDFKNNPLSWMATEDLIIDGFNKDPNVVAAGVKYDAAKGTMTFKNASDPQVQQIMKDLKTDRFMKPIEDPKPKQQEVPKPTPQPQKPTATVEQRTSRPGEAPEATPPAPPMPAPKPVEGYSDGGSFNAPDNLNFYKVDKQDDIVAINPQTQKPIATMQSGETLSRGDGRVDVTPQYKSNDAGPVPDTNVTQLSNIMSSFSDALSNIGKNTQTIPKVSQETATNHPNLIGDTNSQIVNQQKFSPSYDRAMHRISKGTEPTGSFDHFSYGNK